MVWVTEKKNKLLLLLLTAMHGFKKKQITCCDQGQL